MRLSPDSPTAAFKLGEKVDDPLAMYLADIFTVTANWRDSRDFGSVRRDEREAADRDADYWASILMRARSDGWRRRTNGSEGSFDCEETSFRSSLSAQDDKGFRAGQKVVVAVAGAGPAEDFSVADDFAVEVDSFATYFTNNSFALISGEFFGW